jgi:predicted oxidoreductase
LISGLRPCLSLGLLLGCAPKPGRGTDGAAGGAEPPLFAVDVVVIGGGPAGMSAAAELLRLGVEDVLLLEQAGALGGSLRYQGGTPTFTFAGSAEQAAAGVVDDPARLRADWPAMTGGDPTSPWLLGWSESSVPRVEAWLGALGLGFSLLPDLDEGASVPRIHRLDQSGQAMGARLAEVLPASIVWTGVGVVGLRPGTAGGAGEEGLGVEVEDAASGETLGWIAAGAVIAASGGFLRSLDLVAAARPELDPAALSLSVAPEADGALRRALEAEGAALDHIDVIGLYAHGTPDPRGGGEELMFYPLDQGPWVNLDGRRFTDESATNQLSTGEALAAQPGQAAWAVMSAATAASLDLFAPLDRGSAEGDAAVPTLDDLLRAGIAVEADSPAALALAMGVDAAAFSAELSAFNDCADTGCIDPWRDAPLTVSPLDPGALVALRLQPALAKAFGGVAVDAEGRVLGADGAPLPGLYAAGELSGMAGGSLVGDLGFSGSLSAVIYSGMVAAESVAQALSE